MIFLFSLSHLVSCGGRSPPVQGWRKQVRARGWAFGWHFRFRALILSSSEVTHTVTDRQQKTKVKTHSVSECHFKISTFKIAGFFSKDDFAFHYFLINQKLKERDQSV